MITPLDEMLDAIIGRLHAENQAEPSGLISDMHALALVVKDTRIRLSVGVRQPEDERPSEEDAPKIPSPAEACAGLARAAVVFEKAYEQAYITWRSNILATEREAITEALRKARRSVMKGERIR